MSVEALFESYTEQICYSENEVFYHYDGNSDWHVDEDNGYSHNDNYYDHHNDHDVV